ncbi:hypothetical protein Tco_0509251 [Tanacetum coccineum]
MTGTQRLCDPRGICRGGDLAELASDTGIQHTATDAEGELRKLRMGFLMEVEKRKGIARAELEVEMESQMQSKNFEIARLLDRLHYYKAVNHEMSQWNQEIDSVPASSSAWPNLGPHRGSPHYLSRGDSEILRRSLLSYMDFVSIGGKNTNDLFSRLSPPIGASASSQKVGMPPVAGNAGLHLHHHPPHMRFSDRQLDGALGFPSLPRAVSGKSERGGRLELLALEERIGNVNTGLTEENISKCMKQKIYVTEDGQLLKPFFSVSKSTRMEMISPHMDKTQSMETREKVGQEVEEVFNKRGIARAELEVEMESQMQSKNFEIARLLDRLHYYKAVNHEMSQRNQESIDKYVMDMEDKDADKKAVDL